MPNCVWKCPVLLPKTSLSLTEAVKATISDRYISVSNATAPPELSAPLFCKVAPSKVLNAETLAADMLHLALVKSQNALRLLTCQLVG